MEDRDSSTSDIWQHAATTVGESLTQVRTRLVELRTQRDTINAQVRELVTEEDRLARMWRIAEGHGANGDS